MQVIAPTAPLTALNWVAAGLAASGFLFEAVADAQKFSFKNKPENKGRCVADQLPRCLLIHTASRAAGAQVHGRGAVHAVQVSWTNAQAELRRMYHHADLLLLPLQISKLLWCPQLSPAHLAIHLPLV